MKEHGLLFKPPMVMARFYGDKCQTRRPITRHNTLMDGNGYIPYAGDGYTWEDFDMDKAWVDKGPSPAGNAGPYLKATYRRGHQTTHRLYPRIQPGDTIWWKEKWQVSGWAFDAPRLEIHYPSTPRATKTVVIPEAADPEGDIQNHLMLQCTDDALNHKLETDDDGHFITDEPMWKFTRVRSSMLMYRWAARFVDHVIAVRPERLLSITDDDAQAEGVVFIHGSWCVPGTKAIGNSPRECFLHLFSSIHGPEVLTTNPWLWVYSMSIDN
jgi:hypothetical protein